MIWSDGVSVRLTDRRVRANADGRGGDRLFIGTLSTYIRLPLRQAANTHRRGSPVISGPFPKGEGPMLPNLCTGNIADYKA